jgi:hypothetical protein
LWNVSGTGQRMEGPWCRTAPGPRRNCYTICRP